MSTLTKIFVGLLVVLSLLLSAATITFVSALGNQRKALMAQIEQTQAE